MRSRNIIFLAMTLVAGVAAAVLAARGTWGVAGEWQWQHRLMVGGRWWMPVAPSLALIALSMWLLRRARHGARISAAWALALVLLAVLLQWSTLGIVPAPPASVGAGAVILSPVATTYFGEAGNVSDMREFLAGYAARMRTFSQHAATYPPGPIVFFWLARQAIERSPTLRAACVGAINGSTGLTIPDISAVYSKLYGQSVPNAETIAAIVSAWLLGLLGCLAILPIYLIARDRAGDAAAVCAGALAAAVPSLILFTPSVIQLVTLDAVLCLYLFHLAWSRRSLGWGIAAGAMWALSALTSLAILVMPALFVGWTIIERVAAAEPESAHGSATRVAASWAAGALVCFAVAYLALGIDFPAIMRSALGAHRTVTTQAFARTYSRWLGWNLFDFWMFLGAPLGLWLLRQMVTEAIAAVRGHRAALTALLWALVVTLGVLDASGVVRAEVGRIWMFLMLPAAAVAGGFVARRAQPEVTLGIVVAAQLLQTAVFERYLALFVVL